MLTRDSLRFQVSIPGNSFREHIHGYMITQTTSIIEHRIACWAPLSEAEFLKKRGNRHRVRKPIFEQRQRLEKVSGSILAGQTSIPCGQVNHFSTSNASKFDFGFHTVSIFEKCAMYVDTVLTEQSIFKQSVFVILFPPAWSDQFLSLVEHKGEPRSQK